jgi:hypothetical protein
MIDNDQCILSRGDIQSVRGFYLNTIDAYNRIVGSEKGVAFLFKDG